MSIEHPYLLFLGDAADPLAAKTAAGVAHWRPEWCAGQLRLDDCHADLGLPDLTLEEAARRMGRSKDAVNKLYARALAKLAVGLGLSGRRRP